jgi:predicted AAA+ superfamily ATPase
MLESAKEFHYFDLENQLDLARLENPLIALADLPGLVVLDEIQLMPELFRTLRVLVDKQKHSKRFLILGSASPERIRHASESLAGRIEFIELAPFDMMETGIDHWKSLWARGGFPPSFLAKTEEDSVVWRRNFIRTFLERDVPSLGFQLSPVALRRFWTMIAHYHGQIWNSSEIGKSLGISDHTARRYLDLLSGTYLVRQLPAWYENIKKRQVKAPKIYLRDTGLLHTLLGLPDAGALEGHPKCGSSWEGFAIEQILRLFQPDDLYFWATHNGAEIDLLAMKNGKRYGFECKYTDAPRTTRSMHLVNDELKLEHLFLLYPGVETFPLTEQITAIGIDRIADLNKMLQ